MWKYRIFGAFCNILFSFAIYFLLLSEWGHTYQDKSYIRLPTWMIFTIPMHMHQWITYSVTVCTHHMFLCVCSMFWPHMAPVVCGQLVENPPYRRRTFLLQTSKMLTMIKHPEGLIPDHCYHYVTGTPNLKQSVQKNAHIYQYMSIIKAKKYIA